MVRFPEDFKRESQTLVNYSFQNAIEGTGSLTFYTGDGLDDSGTSNDFLSSNTFYSDSIEVNVTDSSLSSSFTKAVEHNYDTSLLVLPQTINGTAQLAFSWAVYGHASAAITGKIIAKLILLKGAAETVIGTATTEEFTRASGSASWAEQTSNLLLTLTETHFNKGDVIRLNVEGWLKNSTGTFGGKIAWGQDPQNRDGDVIIPSSQGTITKMNISVPFEINQ